MKYIRNKNTIVLRLDPGEELLESITETSKKENIVLAEVSAIGAVSSFSVGAYDVKEKRYIKNDFEGVYEIISLSGNITKKDGEEYIHLHMCAANEKGEVCGGHLNRAVISATAEIFLNIHEFEVERRFDENIGLNVFDF